MKQTMIQQISISRRGSKSSSKARSVGGEMNEFPKNPVSCQPLTDRRPKSVKNRGRVLRSTTSSTILHLFRLVCATDRYSDRPGSYFVNRVNKGMKKNLLLRDI